VEDFADYTCMCDVDLGLPPTSILTNGRPDPHDEERSLLLYVRLSAQKYDEARKKSETTPPAAAAAADAGKSRCEATLDRCDVVCVRYIPDGGRRVFLL
jgi:hypothetical protein